MWTQIRLLLEEQSDQGPQCLPICKNRFEKFARIFSWRHKQTTFSDAGFLGIVRVNVKHDIIRNYFGLAKDALISRGVLILSDLHSRSLLYISLLGNSRWPLSKNHYNTNHARYYSPRLISSMHPLMRWVQPNVYSNNFSIWLTVW